VVEAEGRLVGVVTGTDLQQLIQAQQSDANGRQLADVIKPNPVVAYPDEPSCVVVYRMAETGFTRFPVVERSNPHKLLGIISLSDLLKARTHHLEEEHRRERVLRIGLRFPLRSRRLHSTA
jgi:chloride channel protein, CIC family